MWFAISAVAENCHDLHFFLIIRDAKFLNELLYTRYLKILIAIDNNEGFACWIIDIVILTVQIYTVKRIFQFLAIK